MTVLVYSKIADYSVRKIRITNVLFIVEWLVVIKDRVSRLLPITLMKFNDCDINLIDGTILSTDEIIEIADYHVFLR